MYPEWRSKNISSNSHNGVPMRFIDTHKNIFVPMDPILSPMRMTKLKLEEKREKTYNIINNTDDYVI